MFIFTSKEKCNIMRKLFLALWIISAAAVLTTSNAYAYDVEGDLNTIKTRLYELAMSQRSNNHDIEDLLRHFDGKTGLFTDLDYKDQTASQWQPGYHWRRLTRLAVEYQDPRSPNWHSDRVKSCVIKAIRTWVAQPPIANNGWWNLIGVPTEMARIFVLMENEIGPELVRSSITDGSMPRIGSPSSVMRRGCTNGPCGTSLCATPSLPSAMQKNR